MCENIASKRLKTLNGRASEPSGASKPRKSKQSKKLKPRKQSKLNVLGGETCNYKSLISFENELCAIDLENNEPREFLEKLLIYRSLWGVSFHSLLFHMFFIFNFIHICVCESTTWDEFFLFVNCVHKSVSTLSHTISLCSTW